MTSACEGHDDESNETVGRAAFCVGRQTTADNERRTHYMSIFCLSFDDNDRIARYCETSARCSLGRAGFEASVHHVTNVADVLFGRKVSYAVVDTDHKL